MTRSTAHALDLELMRDVHAVWPKGERFVSTASLVELLVHHSDRWGEASPFGRPLNAQRLYHMLHSIEPGVFTVRPDPTGPRGYAWSQLESALGAVA